MNFYTPRMLKYSAADSLVKAISNTRSFKKLRVFEIFAYGSDKGCNSWFDRLQKNRLSILEKELVDLSDALTKYVCSCNAKTLQCIEDAFFRLGELDSSAGTFLLQFLLSSKVTIKGENAMFASLVKDLTRAVSFPNVKKLSLIGMAKGDDDFDWDYLFDILALLQNVEILEFSNCYLETDHFICIQDLLRKLTNLNLGDLFDEFHSGGYLSAFFFRLKHLHEVEECYMRLEEPPLSFPNLKILLIKTLHPWMYGFFKMFVHFYQNVEVIIDDQCEVLNSRSSVSWFDAVLSHTIVLNPKLRLQTCSLCFEDMLSIKWKQALNNWPSLTSIKISILLHNRNSLMMKQFGQNFELLLKCNSNVSKLVLCFYSVVSDSEAEVLFLGALEKYGSRLKVLKIWEEKYHLTHKTAVSLINMCSNISSLYLILKPASKYCKTIKLKTLTNLDLLKTGWVSSHCHSRSQVLSLFISDILKNSPNLHSFSCLIDSVTMDALTRIKFGQNLRMMQLLLFFPISTTTTEDILHFMKSLPKLEDFNIQCCLNPFGCLLDMERLTLTTQIKFKETKISENCFFMLFEDV